MKIESENNKWNQKEQSKQLWEILEQHKNSNRFPVICPICGERQVHLYFSPLQTLESRVWIWCSYCKSTAYSIVKSHPITFYQGAKCCEEKQLFDVPIMLELRKRQIDEIINAKKYEDILISCIELSKTKDNLSKNSIAHIQNEHYIEKCLEIAYLCEKNGSSFYALEAITKSYISLVSTEKNREEQDEKCSFLEQILQYLKEKEEEKKKLIFKFYDSIDWRKQYKNGDILSKLCPICGTKVKIYFFGAWETSYGIFCENACNGCLEITSRGL